MACKDGWQCGQCKYNVIRFALVQDTLQFPLQLQYKSILNVWSKNDIAQKPNSFEEVSAEISMKESSISPLKHKVSYPVNTKCGA